MATTTPLGAVARGLAAGVAGTAAMTAWQLAVQRVRGGGGAKPRRWADAPVPAQLAKRVLEGVFERRVTLKDEPKLTYAVHFGYGTAWGAVYGLVQETVDAPPLAHGLAFGAGVWGTSYVVLPPTGLYQPIWRYSPQELALDLSYHLVYGLGVSAAHRALARL